MSDIDEAEVERLQSELAIAKLNLAEWQAERVGAHNRFQRLAERYIILREREKETRARAERLTSEVEDLKARLRHHDLL